MAKRRRASDGTEAQPKPSGLAGMVARWGTGVIAAAAAIGLLIPFWTNPLNRLATDIEQVEASVRLSRTELRLELMGRIQVLEEEVRLLRVTIATIEGAQPQIADRISTLERSLQLTMSMVAPQND